MDLEYLYRRRDEERERADNAECEVARKAHQQLADFFGMKIDEAGGAYDAPFAEPQQAQAV